MSAWLRGVVAAVGLVLGATSAGSAAPTYHFEWRSFTSRTEWKAGEPVTTRGELTGHGTALLEPVGHGLYRLSFTSDNGSGSGIVGAGVPEELTFPVAVQVGTPPAPPHLVAGWFKPAGTGSEPDAFDIVYTEGFICRTTPERCGGITTWERSFSAHATRG